MSSLTEKHCTPCKGGDLPFTPEDIILYIDKIEDWHVIDNHHLYKKFIFKDFKEALKFVNSIGNISEEEGHHPDITLSWGKVEVRLFTHKINGLSINDFILAARFDNVFNKVV